MLAAQAQSPRIRERLTRYARDLRDSGAIRTDLVQAAFEGIPRHLFLPSFFYGPTLYEQVGNQPPSDEVLDLVYANNALVTRFATDDEPVSSSSGPSIMAKMLEALELQPGMRVLEIGAGTGYNAALIAAVTGGPVHTVEAGQSAATDARGALAALGLDGQVTVLHSDGYYGDAQSSPWDRIIVTCGIAGLSPHWLDQLAPGGLVLAPIALAGGHPITKLERTGSSVDGHVVSWADFMPAVGPLRPTEYFRHDPHHAVSNQAAQPITTVIGAGLTWTQYCSLTCWLGANDRRTTRAYVEDNFNPALGMTALVEGGSAAWIQMSGQVVTVGPVDLTRTVVRRLTELVQGWLAAGEPSSKDWRVKMGAHPNLPTALFTPQSWYRL